MLQRSYLILGLLFLLTAWVSGCGPGSAAENDGLKTLRIPMTTNGPKSLDPVKGSTQYENVAASQVYETLVQYKYLKRPYELEPLLLAKMPSVSEDGLTYHFELKPDVFFHDDPCFPDGKGRPVVSSDVFYSWKRMADKTQKPNSWWLYENTIVGFDDYRAEQQKLQDAGKTFDYDAEVEGFEILNDREFKVTLTEPVSRFMWVLAMFQTAVVPREAVDKYETKFGRHPVGTGPYMLAEEDWKTNQKMVFKRNPNYHACYYPEEHMPEDESSGRDQPAGTRLPIADQLEITFFVDPQPMWLKFQTGQLDYTQVPAEYFTRAYFKRNQKLRPSWTRAGVKSQAIPLLDFIFHGFNMEDDLLGGYSEEKKALRHAISLAIDLNEINEAFYEGINQVYDGPIPPGLDGYPPEGNAPVNYRGRNLEKARELLAKAGYPGGKGLPQIEYYTMRSNVNQQMVEMVTRQLKEVGIKLNPHLVDFGTLIESVDNKKAPMFSFAWGSDYPDAENNLALFYSPNVSPGSNHYNYSRPEYDALYEQIRSMPPSDERTDKYVSMRDMIIEDTPYIGSMARTRFYLLHPRLKNAKVSEVFSNWYKYLDVDPVSGPLQIK